MCAQQQGALIRYDTPLLVVYNIIHIFIYLPEIYVSILLDYTGLTITYESGYADSLV